MGQALLSLFDRVVAGRGDMEQVCIPIVRVVSHCKAGTSFTVTAKIFDQEFFDAAVIAPNFLGAYWSAPTAGRASALRVGDTI
jgi:hypothetical protein